ncbi:MAG: FxsA family protein [Phycisphaerae bacterium]
MLLRLLLLMIVVPLVELVILLRLAERFHWGPTIALVFVTGVVGASLARREGVKAFSRLQAELAAGRVPANAIVNAALILVAGLLLITPGILTDIGGFALLIAPVRTRVGAAVADAFRRRLVMVPHFGRRPDTTAETFIDAEFTAEDVGKRTDEEGK